MTTLRPAAESEGAAPRASDDPTSERPAETTVVPMTRREARALERAAALAAGHGSAPVSSVPTASSDSTGAADASAASPIADTPSITSVGSEPSVVAGPGLPAPVDGPAVVEGLVGRRESRAAERPGRPHAAPAAKRSPRSSAGRRTTALSGGARRQTAAQRTTRWGVAAAMLFVGATIVSTSVPANAYFVDTPEHVAVKLAAAAEAGTTPGGAAAVGGQDFVASGAISSEDLDRDGYSVTSKVQAIKNTSTGAFTNDSTAAVQWPFAVGVPISSGFGARQVANCSFCSTFHEGLDFVPGAGSPIQIIADGTVSKVDQGSGALGYNVWIEHTIGGKKITSVYAHMIAGSIRVTEGQQVKVGQIVGLVGSTGNSTGAHLHFEIHIDGVPVDPYPWLEANAGQR
ncbi:peptidoglycan DD-metalloendopeptidase family protein [Frondihabitans peucedani]|uniref:M23ase beta-sheet core domain-containing protein n=1 Tax=Frondihabitans peucedani TaxID=598626 RepID=A0ABP8E022_9MICO